MNRRISLLVGLSALLPLCVLLLVSASPATAISTITVTTTQDAINGNDGLCSLREAIIAANTDTASGGVTGECIAGNGADTVYVPAGIYDLEIAGISEGGSQTGDLDICSTVNVSGAGPDATIIDANGLDRVLDIICGNNTVTISGVRISGGLNVVTSNGEGGGGIRKASSGNLIVSNSSIVSNTAWEGGGIANYQLGTLTVISSSVQYNSSPNFNGGVFNYLGAVTITQSLIQANTGQGVFNFHGNLAVISTTIAGNIGRGILNSGDGNSVGRATIINSVVMSNVITDSIASGAGIYNFGNYLTLINSTVSGNSASHSGGGIFNIRPAFGVGVINLYNASIIGNRADADDNGTGDGGGVTDVNAFFYSANSLMANNYAGSGRPTDCNGILRSQGYNLIQNTSGCTITGTTTGNILNVEPILGLLQNNGGPTLTHALLPGSPAIDAGNPADCTDASGNLLTTDQRGFPRPLDGNGDGNVRCDIGAYEYSVPEQRVYLPLIVR